ncbi:MAG TPA: hypothetical protein VM891_14770 [Amaricoccus sp.]|jgi:hypothetical protein|nr:hypothetical protein [Amaricoccus sp.]
MEIAAVPPCRNPLAPAAVLALLLAAGCAAGPAPPDPAECAALFRRYDAAVRLYPVTHFDDRGGMVPPAALSRPTVALRANGCLTSPEDLDGLPALAARLQPFAIEAGGPAIPPTPVHLGIVTGIADEALVTRAFRGLGYRSRGIGAEGLGRRIYIGVFTTQGALDQALAVAREAGFIAPFAATHTRF